MTPATTKPAFFPPPAAFRTWLEAHHTTRSHAVYQRTATFWVMNAKREATRASRLATLIRDSDQGLRIGPLR